MIRPCSFLNGSQQEGLQLIHLYVAMAMRIFLALAFTFFVMQPAHATTDSDFDEMYRKFAKDNNLTDKSSEDSSVADEEPEPEPNTTQQRPSNSEVMRTWDKAIVYVPGSRWAKTPSSVDLKDKHPVMVYLHGCTGITNFNDRPWAKLIADLGFIVVMPDSFARNYRPSNCNPSERRTGYFPIANLFRQEEISWALQQLQQVPWADSNRLFLMGHSEGGVAVSRYNASGFKGVIVSGHDCSGANWNLGTPVLSLNYKTDPWNRFSDMKCSSRVGLRKITEVILPGHEHETYFSKDARSAVQEFLSRLIQKNN
jgi:hypothetical protein